MRNNLKNTIEYIKDKDSYILKDNYILINTNKVLNEICLNKVLYSLKDNGFKLIKIGAIIKAVGVY